MSLFIYKARDASGKLVSGQVDAADEQAASISLMDTSLMVVSLRASSTRKTQVKRQQGRVKTQDLVVFTRQLATMLDAGLPLVQTLSALEEQTSSKAFKVVLQQVTARVEQGESFSEALREHPKVFDRLYTSMVHAGETGGLLAEILDRVATYQEASSRLKKKVKSAMAYPTIVCCIALSIALFLVLKVIPIFADIYKDFGGKLPGPTRLLIHISDTLRHNFPLVVIVGFWAVYGLLRLKKTERGSWFWDRLKLRLPVFGKLIHKVALARFARTFSALIRSGVPILETLRIVGQSAGNKLIEASAMSIAGGIEKGGGIAASMGQHTVFPPMFVRMVAAGEQTGKVDVMLEKISDFYDEEIEAALTGLTALIEPLLIVFLGVVVGSIVICMFLPIFKLNELVQF
jgi:type IV pilus assembly protein PilC